MYAMKRIVLLSIIFALVASLAAPTGAAFALEEDGVPVGSQQEAPEDTLLADKGEVAESGEPEPIVSTEHEPTLEPISGPTPESQPTVALLSEQTVTSAGCFGRDAAVTGGNTTPATAQDIRHGVPENQCPWVCRAV